jgi:predicted RNA methylase
MFQEPLRALRIAPRDYAFVDYGAGKGRVLMLAMLSGFQRVTGVEISARLCAVARENLARFAEQNGRVPNARIVESDAGAFVPEGSHILAYLYNPFGRVILDEVRRQLEGCLQCGTKRIVVIYANPEHASVFSGSDIWEAGPVTPGTATFIATSALASALS